MINYRCLDIFPQLPPIGYCRGMRSILRGILSTGTLSYLRKRGGVFLANIKLFVCCHQPSFVPEHPLLVPIQVGAALAQERFQGFLQDDDGPSQISARNHSYCELTAIYWAWKNADADFYGFFHYRRYLYPDLTAKGPYRLEQSPTLETLNRLGYKDFEQLIPKYDIILPKGEDMHIPVWQHYAQAPFHHGKDLSLIETILMDRRPECIRAAAEYLNGSLSYFGNIFIMKKEFFLDYCAWLFPILAEFDAQADTSSYSPQEARVDGYLAERLLGVYVFWLQRYNFIKILELPRVHFVPQRKDFLCQNFVNALLPPGSRRRSSVKGLIRGQG